MSADSYTIPPRPVRSAASVLAIICAVGSFVLSVRVHPIWAIVVAAVGIICGALGFLQSISPHVRGGLLSLFAILVCVCAVIFALIAAIFHVL